MRSRGTIIEWNDARGFGFIAPTGGGKPVFLHVSALAAGQRRPIGGETISYELGVDERQRPRALAVRYEGSSARLTVPIPAILVSVVALVAVCGLEAMGKFPAYVPAIYFVMSGLTYAVYRADKVRAQRGDWRVAESTLHLLSLFGGWPGALVAQHVFRHKTRKAAFQAVFCTTVAAHIAVWVWLLTRQPLT